MNSHNHNDYRYRPQHPAADGPARIVPNRPLVKTLSSEALFDGAYEIGIDHAGALYRLKITRQGKLILNK